MNFFQILTIFSTLWTYFSNATLILELIRSKRPSTMDPDNYKSMKKHVIPLPKRFSLPLEDWGATDNKAKTYFPEKINPHNGFSEGFKRFPARALLDHFLHLEYVLQKEKENKKKASFEKWILTDYVEPKLKLHSFELCDVLAENMGLIVSDVDSKMVHLKHYDSSDYSAEATRCTFKIITLENTARFFSWDLIEGHKKMEYGAQSFLVFVTNVNFYSDDRFIEEITIINENHVNLEKTVAVYMNSGEPIIHKKATYHCVDELLRARRVSEKYLWLEPSDGMVQLLYKAGPRWPNGSSYKEYKNSASASQIHGGQSSRQSSWVRVTPKNSAVQDTRENFEPHFAHQNQEHQSLRQSSGVPIMPQISRAQGVHQNQEHQSLRQSSGVPITPQISMVQSVPQNFGPQVTRQYQEGQSSHQSSGVPIIPQISRAKGVHQNQEHQSSRQSSWVQIMPQISGTQDVPPNFEARATHQNRGKQQTLQNQEKRSSTPRSSGTQTVPPQLEAGVATRNLQSATQDRSEVSSPQDQNAIKYAFIVSFLLALIIAFWN